MIDFDNGVVECPTCCGEGHDIEIMVCSSNPCSITCETCDGDGVIEQPIFCSDCYVQMSGVIIDLEDSEDIVEYEVCKDCSASKLITYTFPGYGSGNGGYLTITSSSSTLSPNIQYF